MYNTGGKCEKHFFKKNKALIRELARVIVRGELLPLFLERENI